MSTPPPGGDDKFLEGRIERAFIAPDGSSAAHGVITGTNMDSPDERREALAEVMGSSPDEIILGTDENIPERLAGAGQAGKMAVAFSSKRWNSSWEPSGGNPNLN